MIDNARKYKLDVCNLISYGISATGTSYQCSLLENFTVNINNTTCNYPQLTIEQLGLLDKPEFEKRVEDYLTFLNIESPNLKTELINKSSYTNPDCIDCRLNSDFLVYRFLDGVRVINIGEIKGIAQYKAYPKDANSSGYTWQTNPTFFDLDLNSIYVFEVRDYYNDQEFCKVSKTISLSSLVQSTTYTPTEKLVFIDKKVENNTSSICYNNGCITINPALSGIEKLSINYLLSAEGYGDAVSFAELCCKTNGSTTFQKISCATSDSNINVNNTFTLNQGDIMCYKLNTQVPTMGSCGCACIELVGVDGLSTTIPTIDVGRCCESIESEIPPTNIIVSTTRTTDSSTTSTCAQNGIFEFTPEIPINKCVTLYLSGNTTGELGGISNYVIKYKKNGGTFFNTVAENSNNIPQPQLHTVIVCHGDELNYTLNTEASLPGGIATSAFKISNIDNNFGINATIGTPSNDEISVEQPKINSTTSICNQFKDNNIMNGYINTNNITFPNQCVEVSLNITTSVLGTKGFSELNVCCQPSGSTGFVSIGRSTSTSPVNNITYFYCQGDIICYNGSAYATIDSEVVSSVEINETIGYNGVNAIINSAKYCDCIVDNNIIS